MSDLAQLLTEIDELRPEDLEVVYRHVARRRNPSYWLIPGDRLRAIGEMMTPLYENSGLSDEDIDALIEDSIREVRHGQPADRGD